MCDDFKLPEHTPLSNRYQILSISGGGYRGLYSIILLEKLEHQTDKLLSQCFDCIAGTSIGGIIAASIALKIPTTTIREAFEKHGSSIFPQELFSKFKKKVRSQYKQSALKKAIMNIVGDDNANKPFTDIRNRLIIPAVSQTSATPILYRSYNDNENATLLDVTLATSSAPTFFEPYEKNNVNYVDGVHLRTRTNLLTFLLMP